MTSSSSLYGTVSTQNSSSGNSTSLYGEAGTPIPDASGNVVVRGTLTVNGCAILTNCNSFSFLPLNAETIGIGASATAIGIGSGSGITTINNQLATANYSFPVGDGISGQVLVTNGAGVLSFAAASSVGKDYDISASATTGGANFNLNSNLPTTDTVKFASGTGVTVSQTNASEINFAIGQSVATTAEPVFAGATLGAITVGVADNQTITTTTGELRLSSAGGAIKLPSVTSIYTDTTGSFGFLNQPTTVNAFVAATSLNLGATTGTTNVNNNLLVEGTGTFTGDVAVNGGDITTTATTANLFTTNATTISIGGAGNGTSTGIINLGTDGQTYLTNVNSLIVQNSNTTQGTNKFLNQTSTSPILITTTARRSMKCVVTINDDVTGDVHSAELLIVRKASTAEAFVTVYAEVFSNAPLATFTVTDTGTALNLYATKASSNSTDIYVLRNSLGVSI